MTEVNVTDNESVLTDEENEEQIARFQARQEELVEARRALLASPDYRRKVRNRVKTKWSRRKNQSLAPRGGFAGIVPKSVALYNMCGDNAYERAA